MGNNYNPKGWDEMMEAEETAKPVETTVETIEENPCAGCDGCKNKE